MSKRMTAIGAAALMLALGCEGRNDHANETQTNDRHGAVVGQTDQTTGETTNGKQEGETHDRFDQAPQLQNQNRQQGQMGQQGQMNQHQMGQQQGQMGQAGAGQAIQGPGQVVQMESQSNFNQTLSRLTRDMRQNDLQIVSQIRFDRRERERAMRNLEQGQATRGQTRAQTGTPGQAMQQGEIGDMRLIVFRRPDVEAKAVESQGPQALLNMPRELLVYERGDQAIVAFRVGEQTAAPGTEEPTSELLQRVVRDATQGTTRQPTAQRTTHQGQQPMASAEHRTTARSGQTSATVGQAQTQADQRQARVNEPSEQTRID